jgi:hypothetical protein
MEVEILDVSGGGAENFGVLQRIGSRRWPVAGMEAARAAARDGKY